MRRGGGDPCPHSEFQKWSFCVLKRRLCHCRYFTIVFAIFLIAVTVSTSSMSFVTISFVLCHYFKAMSHVGILPWAFYTVIFPSYLTCDWYSFFLIYTSLQSFLLLYLFHNVTSYPTDHIKQIVGREVFRHPKGHVFIGGRVFAKRIEFCNLIFCKLGDKPWILTPEKSNVRDLEKPHS